jgi:hypothetical protein
MGRVRRQFAPASISLFVFGALLLVIYGQLHGGRSYIEHEATATLTALGVIALSWPLWRQAWPRPTAAHRSKAPHA